jgi:hypothetical protein
MYQITSEIYLDKINKCYKKIIIISPNPTDDILKSIIKTIPREKLSPYDEIYPCCQANRCLNAFVNPNEKCELLCVDQISILFQYLLTNSFIINTDITKIMQDSDVKIPNLICFISKTQ